MTVYLLLILPVFLCTYLFVIVFVSLSNTIVYICTKASFCDNSVFLCTTFTMVMILYRNFITNLLVICLKINHNEQLTSQGFFFYPFLILFCRGSLFSVLAFKHTCSFTKKLTISFYCKWKLKFLFIFMKHLMRFLHVKFVVTLR